jgi:signal transduction histidine kinase
LGYLLKIAEEEDDIGKVRALLLQANEQIATVHQIAAQTLNFARPVLAPKEVDLIELAEAALRIHRRRIQGQRIHLVRDFSDSVLATVHTGEILQVVSNLLANALDAMPDGGSIAVRLRKRGPKVQLIVADSGHGIKPEHLERLFEPFFSTKESRGTGLGLALLKKIVERHSGTISARSSISSTRAGTTFRVTLPEEFTEAARVGK